MKLLLITLLLISGACTAQSIDTLFYERFETGGASFTLNSSDESGVSAAAGYNQWIINDAYTGGSGQLICSGFPTTFTVPTTPPQPAGTTGGPATNYMHILSDAGQAAGILNCSFLAANGLCGGNEYNFSRMSMDVNTSTYDSVTVSFLWLCAGAPSIYGELYYSTDSGTSWSVVTVPSSQYINQPTWAMRTVSIPVFAGQSTLRFGFRFVNEISFSATDPGFAIDEFLITATSAVPPPVAVFSASDSSFCQNTCIDFTDLSLNNPTSWFWIFQGSTTSFSSLQHPSGICYNTPGTFPVTLIVENAAGTDTLTVTTITVYENPLAPVITVSGDTLFATPGFTTYEWYLDMVLIAGANGDTLITASNGTYTVTATDSNGCFATSLPVLLNTGLNEPGMQPIKMYPNPTTGNIFIETGTGSVEVVIYNSVGKKVDEILLATQPGSTFNLSHLAAGYYTIQLKDIIGNMRVAKLIKM